jgi:hypothetical protein
VDDEDESPEEEKEARQKKKTYRKKKKKGHQEEDPKHESDENNGREKETTVRWVEDQETTRVDDLTTRKELHVKLRNMRNRRNMKRGSTKNASTND